MAEIMSNDDLSFQDLLVTYGTHVNTLFIHNGKGRSKYRSNYSDSSSRLDSDAPLVQMLAKFCLRHEDMLNAICFERSFLLFLQAGKRSIFPTMFMASKEWHTQKQQAGVTCPLLQALFLKMIEELVQRIGRLNTENNEDVFCANLRSKQILTAQNR